MRRIMIQKEEVGLGRGNSVWKKMFLLDKNPESTKLHYQIKRADRNNKLRINKTHVGNLQRQEGSRWGSHEIDVKEGILRAGQNSIEIESVWLDDPKQVETFQFREIVLEVSP